MITNITGIYKPLGRTKEGEKASNRWKIGPDVEYKIDQTQQINLLHWSCVEIHRDLHDGKKVTEKLHTHTSLFLVQDWNFDKERWYVLDK